MKKIEFGFANEIEPKGSWEGIGIKEGLLLTEADYYGAIEYDGNSYIVAKVVEDKYGRYPELLNNFIVRGALVDMYADGSNTLFIDQERTFEAEQIEKYFNNALTNKDINNIGDILTNVNGLNKANKLFTLMEMDERIIATSITHEAFEVKNEAIKSCRQSFSDMQRHIQEQTNSINR